MSPVGRIPSNPLLLHPPPPPTTPKGSGCALKFKASYAGSWGKHLLLYPKLQVLQMAQRRKSSTTGSGPHLPEVPPPKIRQARRTFYVFVFGFVFVFFVLVF